MAAIVMNDRRLLRALTLACACLIAVACGDGAAPAGEPPLAGARIGGPFALIGEDGATVRDRDFEGRYRLVYFGYTFCPDVCPVDMLNLGRGLALFEEKDPVAAAKIQPIFISVDPARDTPAILAEFTDAFHPRFLGLTGSEGRIASVARAYGVSYTVHDEGGGEDYLVDHSRAAYLLGPAGEPIALIPQDETPEAVAAELARWVS